MVRFYEKRPNIEDPRWNTWKHKIEICVVPILENAKDRWARENFARNYLSTFLVNVDPMCAVLFSDVDEIPDKTVILGLLPQLTNKKWFGLLPKHYYYYLNLCTPMRRPFGCFSLIETLIENTPQGLRDLLVNPPGPSGGIIPGGWHFSYCGGWSAIQEKLSAFSHAEYDTDYWKNPDRINQALTEHKDLFDRDVDKFTLVDLIGLPGEVRLNPERYSHLMLKYESPLDKGYILCAYEGAFCNLPSNCDVAYGANGCYNYLYNQMGFIGLGVKPSRLRLG